MMAQPSQIHRQHQPNYKNLITTNYNKALLNPAYRYFIYILGAPVHLFILIYYLCNRKKDAYQVAFEEAMNKLIASGYKEKLILELQEQAIAKQKFFNEQIDEAKQNKEVEQLATIKLKEKATQEVNKQLESKQIEKLSLSNTFSILMKTNWFLPISLIPGILMYALIFIYSQTYLKFIFERLVMALFVILGVSTLVFTILHLSPMTPARNILGETATTEQIMKFNAIYGLDQPYLVQLWHTIKGIFTFDLGNSFAGNENVTSAIARKFPITLTLTVISLFVSMLIAIPVGIISATKRNTFWDYSFMFIALIGLSIPSFWQGLIFILNFSIKLGLLPATYNPQNALSIIMPVIVLGTGLSAAVARMTRSSMLEVINEDYILTAKAKGLAKRQVLLRHVISNAMIPIITVIGLQFGGMLGGSAVTEKVFNISGLGNYIVDKQFIPDIPAVMGGVVYTAITISLINVIIDIMYAFFDPRIRAKMKQN